MDWFPYDRDLRHERVKLRAILKYLLSVSVSESECLWSRILESSPRLSKNSHRRCSIKKNFLKNFAIFTGKHLRWSLFLISSQLNFAKIFKNTYFEKHMQTAASVALWNSCCDEALQEDICDEAFLRKFLTLTINQ